MNFGGKLMPIYVGLALISALGVGVLSAPYVNKLFAFGHSDDPRDPRNIVRTIGSAFGYDDDWDDFLAYIAKWGQGQTCQIQLYDGLPMVIFYKRNGMMATNEEMHMALSMLSQVGLARVVDASSGNIQNTYIEFDQRICR